MTERSNSSGFGRTIETLAHWFFVIAALLYACGFLVVFTFLRQLGINSIDFVEAKYMHVGVLFALSALVVVLPLWWLLWPLRGQSPDSLRQYVKNLLLLPSWRDRIARLFLEPIKNFFYPEWSPDPIHGINASPAVRISMILLLWAFIILVIFASPDFGRKHSQLAFYNFSIPMLVLGLGYLADVFKNGSLSDEQQLLLKRGRCALRSWWLIVGALFLYYFTKLPYFDSNLDIFAVLYFGVSGLLISGIFLLFFCWPRRGSGLGDTLSRMAILEWLLYTTQWAMVIWQIWSFIWTIRTKSLGVSLLEVLLGRRYLTQMEAGLRHAGMVLPSGAIYFVFLIVLIVFFVIRVAYRLKQIDLTKDAGYRRATTISTALIVGPLSYISILAFAYTIYPYIPSRKGGGDYTGNDKVRVEFNSYTDAYGLRLIEIPRDLQDKNASNALILLDESSEFIFLADKQDGGGAAKWRAGEGRPTIYEVHRSAISCIISHD